MGVGWGGQDEVPEAIARGLLLLLLLLPPPSPLVIAPSL